MAVSGKRGTDKNMEISTSSVLVFRICGTGKGNKQILEGHWAISYPVLIFW